MHSCEFRNGVINGDFDRIRFAQQVGMVGDLLVKSGHQIVRASKAFKSERSIRVAFGTTRFVHGLINPVQNNVVTG